MQITIQKMWPLEAGRKSGGFKGTDGTNYYCEIPVYHMLGEGMTIDAPAEKYVSKAGKTSYILDKRWNPGMQLAPHAAQNAAPVGTPLVANSPNSNGYVSETEKQGYIACNVMMKILADAQTTSGKPVETQDMALFAQCATAVWRDHLKGKV